MKADGTCLRVRIEILASAALFATGCATAGVPTANAPGAASATAVCATLMTCQADAVACRDRAEYERRAAAERDRAALMMTLTTAQRH